MMEHDDLATRDESVKRGGGSVVVLRNSQNIIKVSLRSDISISACVVSPNLLCSRFHVILRAVDLQIAFFLNFRSFGANTTSRIILLASNIILHASTSYTSLPPHNINQARYNATSPTTTHNQRVPCGDIPRGMDGEAARFPARSSRANSAMVRDRREFTPKPGKRRRKKR